MWGCGAAVAKGDRADGGQTAALRGGHDGHDPGEKVDTLDLLRSRTQHLHQRVEQIFNFSVRCQNRETYRALLLRLLGFYRPIERALSQLQWELIGLDMSERSKVALLEKDLVALECSAQRIQSAPLCDDLPMLSTLPVAAGCLYVLEGSTMGGQIIAREIERRLGIGPATGGAFYAAYGERNGLMWRAFKERVNAYCNGHESRMAEALEGATATFDAYGKWLAGDPQSVRVELAEAGGR